MTRTLQRRFVVTAMTAITGLILLLLGAINGANLYLVNSRLDHTLQMLSDAGGDAGSLLPPQPPGPKKGGFALPEMHRSDYDTFMASNYFVVRLDSAGQAVYVDVSRTSLISGEDAAALAEQLVRDGKTRGESGRFRYLIRGNAPSGTSAVFLDTSGEGLACLWVLILSAAAGLGCWGLMLAAVILLSRRAIRPIAENMERQKQFVTNAGHELKTPLAIIQSNTEAMELYNGASKWSRNIREQAARLDGLVKDLLLLARMDEGAAAARPEEFALDRLLTEVLAGFAQPIESKGMTLTERIEPDIQLRADRAQVRQLISILLDNGVKHGARDGLLEVSLEQREGRIRLRVRNTCSALPSVPPDKLFDRFYRGDSARNQKTGGYGIGLSMARSIAQANGARLAAGYEAPDKVWFTVGFRPNSPSP